MDIFDGPTSDAEVYENIKVSDYYDFHEDWKCVSTWDSIIIRFNASNIPDDEAFKFNYRVSEDNETPCSPCKLV